MGLRSRCHGVTQTGFSRIGIFIGNLQPATFHSLVGDLSAGWLGMAQLFGSLFSPARRLQHAVIDSDIHFTNWSLDLIRTVLINRSRGSESSPDGDERYLAPWQRL